MRKAMEDFPVFKKFLSDETGASAAEYGLIIAIIGVGLGAASLALGANVAFAVGSAAQDIAALNTAPSGSPSGTP